MYRRRQLNLPIRRIRATFPARGEGYFRGAYCTLDRWTFDPRYTDGRCPICGWAPEGAPNAPAWMMLARRVDWELFGLVMFVGGLIIIGLLVARAAGVH
jgi:hypothetical protein